MEKKDKIIQQNINAIQNKQLEVFLKTSIDNIDFFCKQSTRASPLYKTMISRIRKYGVLTKQKYKNFYVENPDVYEVLVYEEVKQRDLLYYAHFVDKIMAQIFGKKENKN